MEPPKIENWTYFRDGIDIKNKRAAQGRRSGNHCGRHRYLGKCQGTPGSEGPGGISLFIRLKKFCSPGGLLSSVASSKTPKKPSPALPGPAHPIPDSPSKPNSTAVGRRCSSRVCNPDRTNRLLDPCRAEISKGALNMNRMRLFVLLPGLLLAGFCHAQVATGETQMLDLPRASQHAVVTQRIGI